MERFFPTSPENRERLERIRPKVRARHLSALSERDAELFLIRLERQFENIVLGLSEVYGDREDFSELLDRLVDLMARHSADRPEELKRLDMTRMAWPDWHQHQDQIGYIAYVDRIAGTISGVKQHIPYLKELGVTYLHLMPFFETRDGEDDGGYAVSDFRSVDSRLGTMADLEDLASTLHRDGISLCCDLVLNHVADDHPWVKAAKDGDPTYQRYFHVFEDRTLPDLHEETLPDVFPESDPGSFTQVDGLGWVWTSFHRYQWDLNWANPEVFFEFVDIILHLSNRGIDVFRMDAIAFLWKRMGTACQNQPEVHALTRALRSVARAAAPAVIFKAEAIVGPDDLAHYLGVGKHYGMVSDLAYHNALMVQFWSSVAARDARLCARALERMPTIPNNTSWATYIRCHDDIGWAVSDEDATTVGWDGPAHRTFLADYYTGAFEGSDARGVDFQHDPKTGDRRTSGTTASLAGLEAALEAEDEDRVTMAIERILLGHALILGWGGVPLIYMGDEIGLTNDYGFVDQADKAADSRWMHRPKMPWDRAARRSDPLTVEGRIFEGVRKLVETRKSTPQFHARWPASIVESGSEQVLAHLRRHPFGDLLALYNFADHAVAVDAALSECAQLEHPLDRITGRPLVPNSGTLVLPPYGRLWIVSGE